MFDPAILPIVLPLDTLEEITADIQSLMRTRRENNYILGLRLIEAKEKVGHGKWEAYLAENVRIFDKRTAQRWMKWARRVQANETWLPDPDESDKVSFSDEWYTPIEVVDAARRVLGGRFNLDPASCTEANKIVDAERFFSLRPEPASAGIDGLNQRWEAERMFHNPPWCKGTGRFVEKVYSSFRQRDGNVYSAIVILNRGHLAMPWFAPMLAFPICIFNRDLRYRTPGGTKHSPRQGTIAVCVAPQLWRRFKEEFSPFGRIVWMDEDEEGPPQFTSADYYPDFK